MIKQKILILLIGKGQVAYTNKDNPHYREVVYYLQDEKKGEPAFSSICTRSEFEKTLKQNHESVVFTPFVAEALSKLVNPPFEHIYILGTREAMWDVLYNYCKNGRLAQEEQIIFDHLKEAVKESKVTPDNLQDVAEAFSNKVNRPASVHLIETAPTEENIWKLLHLAIRELKLSNKNISIDLTHSLRYHPVFFFLIMNYHLALSPDNEIDSIYYGALELGPRRVTISDEKLDDNKELSYSITPIYNLRLLSDMMLWIQAARAFSTYGDADPLCQLLKEERLQSVKNDLNKFSTSIQLNSVTSIIKLAKSLKEKVETAQASPHSPFDFIRDEILKFPNAILEQDKMSAQLFAMAKYHNNHGNMGFAYVAAYEAIVQRMREVFPECKGGDDKIAKAVTGAFWRHNKEHRKKVNDLFKDNGLFLKLYDKLHTIRNSIAHEKGFGNLEPEKEINPIVTYLDIHLQSEKFDQIKNFFNASAYLKNNLKPSEYPKT